MISLKRFHLFVSGRVQGVGFRKATRRKARDLKLTGWVRNLADGQVEIVVEGEKDLQLFIDWLAEGSRMARVEKIEIQTEESLGEFSDFQILY
jgi:acylphosphatase